MGTNTGNPVHITSRSSFRKVQEYSPSEAAKVYEKALSTRKNIAMFYPQTALQELRPEAAHQRDTVNGHINMANQIVYVCPFCILYFCGSD